ncbi:MAG: carbohydrate ABC transporter permease [Actinomycetota bacterium]
MSAVSMDYAGNNKDGPSIGRIGAWAVLGVVLIASLFPVYWSLRSALTSNQSLLDEPANVLPPEPTTFNFERVLEIGDITREEIEAAGANDAKFSINRAILNSVIVATAITVFQVFFCAMAAYAFARLRFRGREALFTVYLAALLIPPIFSLIPNFLFVRDLQLRLGLFTIDLSWLPFQGNLGFVNTYIGIVMPFLFMTPFAVFFLRQFFLGISREVEEAAVLDGAGHARRFFQVVLPMSIAPLATLALITYITAWNEFLWPFTVAKDESFRVVTVALNDFKSQTPGLVRPDWSGLMTATFVAGAPIIALFALLGRRVVDSIGFSGIK